MDFLNVTQKDLLKLDFPPEALSEDNSRGFKLTSIKAAFVVERLNDVFGIECTFWNTSAATNRIKAPFYAIYNFEIT